MPSVSLRRDAWCGKRAERSDECDDEEKISIDADNLRQMKIKRDVCF